MDVYVDNVLVERWDDSTYTHTDFTTNPATQRPYTTQEKADADASAADAAKAAAEARIKVDTTTDLPTIRATIDSLALLLGDATTAGSIRAWKAPITNNATLTGAQAKALADLLIDDVQTTRKIARQTLRLAKAMVGDYSSADVGAA